jgi:hypothetical protein
MTIAEIHGKLSPYRPNGCHDRMEDLLTSDVFGTMKYAGWKLGFMDWLRSATSPYTGTSASSLLPKDDVISRVHFEFWPTLANGREPDVLLGIELQDGHIIQIMVEAKYLSGASDIYLDAENMTPYYSGDQIADQVDSFPERFPGLEDNPVSACLHFYVTAHSSCPMDAYENAKPHIDRNDIPLFWVNWQNLSSYLKRALQEAENDQLRALLSDLLQLLERKELLPFNGFRNQPPYDFASLIGCSIWPRKEMTWWSNALMSHPKPSHFFGGD